MVCLRRRPSIEDSSSKSFESHFGLPIGFLVGLLPPWEPVA